MSVEEEEDTVSEDDPYRMSRPQTWDANRWHERGDENVNTLETVEN